MYVIYSIAHAERTFGDYGIPLERHGRWVHLLRRHGWSGVLAFNRLGREWLYHYIDVGIGRIRRLFGHLEKRINY